MTATTNNAEQKEKRSETTDRADKRQLVHLIAGGISPTCALDWLIIERHGMPPALWADMRGVTTRAVERSVSRADASINGGGA